MNIRFIVWNMKSAYVEIRENAVHAKQEEFIIDYIHETRLSELKNTEDVLESYYRQATDEDIRIFCQSSCFYVNDLDSLVSAATIGREKRLHIFLIRRY